jgi:beta-1,4-N-acetylglucosaminyltransferase
LEVYGWAKVIVGGTGIKDTRRFRWISWVAGVALIVGLCLWLGVGRLLNTLATLRLSALLSALGAFILGHIIRIVKWHFPLGDRYSWLELARMFLISKIGGALLPGRVGEVAPVAQARFRSTTVVAWLAVDRIVEAYATLAFGALGLVSLGLGDRRIVVLWIGTFVALLGLLGLMLYRPLWAWSEARSRRWGPIHRLLGLACRISGDMLQFRRYVLPTVGLSLAGTYLDLWLIKSLFLSTGMSVAIDVIAASFCLGALVAFVSITPGGLGIVELTSLYIYNLYGVPEVQTGVMMLLSRSAPLFQAMALALIGLVGRTSRQQGANTEGGQGVPQLKICLVASDGGHLTDLLQLSQEACRGQRLFYLTHRSVVTQHLPNAYLVKKIGLSVWRLFLASLTTLRAFWRERPDVVISTGAEIALPAFYLGKFLFGARLVYVECSGVTTHPTRTGKLLYPIADLFLVQWEALLKHYGPRARYVGGLI